MIRQALALVLLVTGVHAQHPASVDKARMLHAHGLVADAKREAINVIFSGAGARQQAGARLLLAAIAAREERLGTAVELWTEITTKFGATPEAARATALLKNAASTRHIAAAPEPEDVLAAGYLQNAKRHIPEVFRSPAVYSHAMPRTELGVIWLERLIRDFPGTPAADYAYALKVRALFRTLGSRSDSHDFARVKSAFDAMQKAFPKSSRLDQLRYLIGDAYWGIGLELRYRHPPTQKAPSREDEQKAADMKLRSIAWLRQVGKGARGGDYWHMLAKHRLEKFGY